MNENNTNKAKLISPIRRLINPVVRLVNDDTCSTQTEGVIILEEMNEKVTQRTQGEESKVVGDENLVADNVGMSHTNMTSTQIISNFVSAKKDILPKQEIMTRAFSKETVVNTLNFDVILRKIIIEKSDTESGEKEAFSYGVTVVVYMQNGSLRSFEANVEGSKIKTVEWLKNATMSLARIPRGRDEIEEFQAKVQRCIETEDVPIEVIYPNAGWRKVQGVGWHYIYATGVVGNNVLASTKREGDKLDIFADKLGTKEIFDLAVDMCNVCQSGIASTEIFLFVHTTVMATLFELAGHPLNFVFGVVGVTNSRKTSLVTALAKVFNREKLIADAEFATATNCGIEKTLSMYRDAPILIDDFKPGVNQEQQRRMSQKLDELLRLYGNRVPKKRMTDFMADEDKKFFPIGGGCILTMEIVDGVLSSLSRMFVTEISNDEVVNERLHFYQENRWVLPTHIYDFLTWVTQQFENIVIYIQTYFPVFREKYVFEFGRYSEMYATFMITAEIFMEYAKARDFWRLEEKDFFMRNIDIMLFHEIKQMENRSKYHDKGTLVLQVLSEAVQKKSICTLWLNEDTCRQKAEVYEDGQFLYVKARSLRLMLNQYCKNYHETMQIVSEDELIGLLERLNILDIIQTSAGRQRSRKLPIQHGNTLRYLYIKKEKLYNFDA